MGKDYQLRKNYYFIVIFIIIFSLKEEPSGSLFLQKVIIETDFSSTRNVR